MNKTRALIFLVAIATILNGLFNIAIAVTQLFQSTLWQNLSDISRYANVFEFRETSSLLTLLAGFVLVMLGVGLFRGNYFAWLWTLVLSAVNAINSWVPPASMLGFCLSLFFGILLLVSGKAFRRTRLSRMNYSRLVAFLTVVISLIYGVLGAYLLRAQFHGLHSGLDAFYFTLVTYSTLGYGDIYPLTANAKIFVCSMIVVGVSAFVATLTLVVSPLIQRRMEGVLSMMDKLKFKNHVVIVGYNALARYFVKAMMKANLKCVFVTKTEQERESIESSGFQAFVGDTHSSEKLEELGIQSARYAVFVSENDAENILGTMAVESVCGESGARQVRIVTRVEQEMNVDKAYKAGADLVISASQLAGDNIAQALLQHFEGSDSEKAKIKPNPKKKATGIKPN